MEERSRGMEVRREGGWTGKRDGGKHREEDAWRERHT